jgi:hypothetical protein
MMKRIRHCKFIDRSLNKCPNIERNPIFPQKSVQFVNFRLPGEKSGKVVGMKSNIVPTDAATGSQQLKNRLLA